MTSVLVVLIATIALLVVIMVLVRGMRSAPGGEPARYPFEQRSPLTERELVMYSRLRKALPDHIVLSQVGLPRILRVEGSHEVSIWLNRISGMTIDFLVCLPDSRIVAAIELDDAAPATGARALAEARKTKALESAGIKLLRFAEIPDEAELRKTFLR